ncbi:MAG: hypothetical protein BGO51_01775 [Rhodospirillales bacterium 69-11]|nr:hypothetical protein [Rhodospirillales bacterium]MBN8930314.1 hypothetical protein [Rhodospirillales bacterium]OJW25336.1 MAG: hypothetical protein BGO51_01775 [Rhodospirillales bacterium 69-11]
MHFEGAFRVPGRPDEVMRRFADVPRMAGCMPGAVLEPQAEDGSWPGAMVVAFGPKKVAFKGRATCAFDQEALTGWVHGRGTANLRAARIGVKVAFALEADPDAPEPATRVKIVSDAELGGVLADFARTGGVAVANAIMADFARRAAEEFARDAPEPDASLAAARITDAPTSSMDEAEAPSGRASGARGLGARDSGAQDLEAQGSEARDPGTPIASAEPAGAGVAPAGTVAASPPSPVATPMPTQGSPRENAPLKAHGILWAVLKAKLLDLLSRLGLRRAG